MPVSPLSSPRLDPFVNQSESMRKAAREIKIRLRLTLCPESDPVVPGHGETEEAVTVVAAGTSPCMQVA